MKPLILWGGTDLNPDYYDTYIHSKTQKSDHNRDYWEVRDVESAIFKGQPVIGVCRGAQLLCVSNDGMLYQHSEGHNQAHNIYSQDGLEFKNVAADHHQIMCPKGKDYLILAYDKRPTKVWINETETKILPIVPGVIWWPETKCLGIQPHPEWEPKGSAFVQWINEGMKEKGIDYEF